jgi:cellulose synthase/poly-beta-1,6-N-acetylglucosamine synthase-like glycosyltransferase
MMKLVFWVCVTFIVYGYLGYPLFLSLLARIWPKPVRKGAYEPCIAIVLSVWNEEDVIERKIRNLLALDYPRGKTEIWIGSDGSTDKTNAIVKSFSDDRIHLMEMAARLGKMDTLNDLVSRTRNEIIIFCDARQIFAANAVKELVGNFADPRVGCVSGELMFQRKGEGIEGRYAEPTVAAKQGATAQGLNLYWNYEKWIRKMESQIHSMLGATGAIYAIRKNLFHPLDRNIVLDDMFVPLKIIQKGYRAVWDDGARAYDEIADSPREEYRRKTRTLFGNYQIFGLFPDLLNPFKSPVALQLFSHKILRVLMPFLLILLWPVNGALCGEPFYQRIFMLQILFYLMAVAGGLARHKKYGIFKFVSKICYMPYVFCFLNFCALVGFWRFITAKQNVAWEKARKTA